MELDDLWSAAVTGDQNYYKEVVEPHRNRIRSSYYAHTHSSSHISNNKKQQSSVLGSNHAGPNKDRTSCNIATVSHSGVGESADDQNGQKDYYLDEYRPRINSGRSYEESLFDEQNKLRTKDSLPVSMDWRCEESQQEERSPLKHDEHQKNSDSDSPHMNKEMVDDSPTSKQAEERSYRDNGSPDNHMKRTESKGSYRSQPHDSGWKESENSSRSPVDDLHSQVQGERTRRTSHRSQKQWEELDKRINRLVSECLHMGSPSNDEEGSVVSESDERHSSQEDIRSRSVKSDEKPGRGEHRDRHHEERGGKRHSGEGGNAGRDRHSDFWTGGSQERDRERHDRYHPEHDDSSQGSTERSESCSSSDERAEGRKRSEYGGLRIRNTMSDSVSERRWVDRGLPIGLSGDNGRKRCFSEGHKQPSPRTSKSDVESGSTNPSEEDSKRFRDPYRQQSSQKEPQRSPNGMDTTTLPAKQDAPKTSNGERKHKQDIKQMLIDAGNQSVQNYRNMIEQGRFIARTYVKPPPVVPVMRYKYTVSYPITYNMMQPPTGIVGKSKSSRNRKKKSGKANVDVSGEKKAPSVATVQISDSEDDADDDADDDDSDDDLVIIETPTKEGAAENPIVL